MKEKLTNERGQVGIGTLIVFIALVLVAAIAAGVLINTAGFLQTQAEDTGQESTAQVSNNVDVVGTSGTADSSGNAISKVRIQLKRTPGSDNVDLSEVSIEYIGDNGFGNLVYADGDRGNVSDSADGTFNISTIKAETGDDEVITADSDRYQIDIDYSEDDAGSAFDGGLGEGSSATLTLTTQDGASREVALSVPDTVSSNEDVRL